MDKIDLEKACKVIVNGEYYDCDVYRDACRAFKTDKLCQKEVEQVQMKHFIRWLKYFTYVKRQKENKHV